MKINCLRSATFRFRTIEDNVSICNVLTKFFNVEPAFEVVSSCHSYERFLEVWKGQRLDLVICDIGLPGKSGIEAVWYIKQKSANTHVMILTVFEEKEKIFQSLCAGASGYMLKSTPLLALKAGFNDILNGGAAMSSKIAMKVISYFNQKNRVINQSGARLTAREIEILSFLEQGMPNKSVAERTSLAVDTVKFHIKNIYLKLQVNSRAELIAKYRTIQ